MIDRRVLKNRAKEVLKASYFHILSVILINLFISQTVAHASALLTSLGLFPVSSLSPLFTMMISFVINLGIGIFVISPLTVGVTKFIIDISRGNNADYSAILFSFSKGNYFKTVKAMSVRMLIGQLLSEQLIIMMRFNLFVTQNGRLPKIPDNIPVLFCYIAVVLFILFALFLIKLSYDYYLIEYIVADNSDISCFTALRLSKTYMKGNRFAAFVLGLSMVGWYFLGMMLCFVGFIFTLPYMHAVFAQLYFELSKETNTNYTQDNNINY